ncbi:MAG: DUF4062 domain-containing protein [Alphaproteobacteria bacterium]|nr:DUF4062 domain-containing protein [Alphaproteobacteria bacterium]
MSSTFQDMQRERDILARLVFPRLRTLLQNRGVELNEVDLRWGVTHAMTVNATTLAICLDAVADCWPHVFGMVGHRIGWKRPLSEAAAFNADFARSLEQENVPREIGVTEFEMRLATHMHRLSTYAPAIVFLRSDELSRDQGFFETGEDIQAFRSWLRNCPAVRCIDYATFEDFEKESEKHLKNHFDNWAAATEGHCDRTGQQTLQIDRTQDLVKLSSAVSKKRPVVLFGEHGAGTTTLCRSWLASQNDGHYIDGRVTGLGALLDLGEYSTTHFATLDIAPDPAAADSATAVLRSLMTAAKGSKAGTASPIVLDHFELGFPTPAHADLSTLPTASAASGLVIVTNEKRILDQGARLGFTPLELARITREQGGNFAVSYLKRFSKELSACQMELLASAAWIDDLQCLILILDELRRYGNFDDLDRRLAELASKVTLADALEEVLSGLRSILPAPWTNAADDALMALAISQDGFCEHELRSLVGRAALTAEGTTRMQLVPAPIWSVVRLALRPVILQRGPRLDLQSGAAIEWATRRGTHGTDAGGLIAAMNDVIGTLPEPRRSFESLRLAEFRDQATGVENAVADPAFAIRLAKIGETYFEGVLSRLGLPSRQRMMDSWLAALLAGKLEPEEAWTLGLAAQRIDERDAARQLLQHQPPPGRQAVDPLSELHIIRDAALAFLNCDGSRFADLVPWLKATPTQDRGNTGWKTAALAVLAAVAYGRIHLNDAEEKQLVAAVQKIANNDRDVSFIAQAQLDIGQLHLVRNNWRKALSAFRKVEALARRLGHARLLCRGLERVSAVSIELNQFKAARAAATESMELAEAAGLLEDEALSYERLIEIERRRANWQQAYELAERFMRRCRETGIDEERALRVLANLEE